MAVTSQIIQNLSAGTLQIIFSDPTEFENVTYNSSGVTYAIDPSIVLSQADFANYYTYLLAFNTALLIQFPTINAFYNMPVQFSNFQIVHTNSPNIIIYNQTSTPSVNNQVYDLTFAEAGKLTTFARRLNAITITPQEYLLGFQNLTQFANQVARS